MGQGYVQAYKLKHGPRAWGICFVWSVLLFCGLQVQYWPEPQQKEVYGNLSVGGKTEDVVNDSLCIRAFEIYRHGSVAAVS